MSGLAVTLSAMPHGSDAALADRPAVLAGVRTFHTLDALRGIAAIAVVLFHTAFIYGMTPPAEGQIAVDLFFVMSGFIIAYRYGADLGRGMSTWTFTKIRMIRLYPLFLLGSVLGVAPILISMAAGNEDALHKALVASFPLAVFMLPSSFATPRIDEIYPLNYVAWSLALEIIINIAYAASYRFWSPSRVAGLLGVAFVGLCACAWHYGTLNGGFDWANAPVGIPRIVYGFAMGVAIHQLYERRHLAVSVPWWVPVAIAGVIFFVDMPVGKALWELLLVTTVVPLIAVAAIANDPPPAAQGACAIAGVFSYVVYSLHAPLVGFFLRAEDRLHLDTHRPTGTEAIVFSLLLVVLCVAAHYAYDKPVRRRLSRRLVSRT